MRSQHLAILQPIIPHYRSDFFQELRDRCGDVDIFTYSCEKDCKKSGFHVQMKSIHVRSILFGPVLLYNPLPFLSKRYDTLVLMLNFGHVTTWLLLILKFFFHKKIIVWGQGISVKRYLKEELHPDWKLKLMVAMSDGVWFYMDKEYQQWRCIFPQKPMVALGNSLSGVNEMLEYCPKESKDALKEKYGIKEKRVFIFCARFESKYRRTDLLLEIIGSLDSVENGYVIIGSGKYKPDFSRYSNVYDFGALYDNEIKRDLFYIADLYLQPGWVGLSIMEAMAYGKPVCTFVRSKETLQCVEYSYIEDGINGMIFKDMNDCMRKLSMISNNELILMGKNAQNTVHLHTPHYMVNQAIAIL